MTAPSALTDTEMTSLMEIAHPSRALGDSIYGSTKVFPDYQAEPGERFPTVGNELFPGMTNENSQIAKFISEGGKVYACRLGLSLHGSGKRT